MSDDLEITLSIDNNMNLQEKLLGAIESVKEGVSDAIEKVKTTAEHLAGVDTKHPQAAPAISQMPQQSKDIQSINEIQKNYNNSEVNYPPKMATVDLSVPRFEQETYPSPPPALLDRLEPDLKRRFESKVNSLPIGSQIDVAKDTKILMVPKL